MRNSRSRSKSKPHHRSRSRSKNYTSRSSSYSSSDGSTSRSTSRSFTRSRSRSIHNNVSKYNDRHRYSRSPTKYHHNTKDYYGHVNQLRSSKYEYLKKSKSRSPLSHHVRYA